MVRQVNKDWQEVTGKSAARTWQRMSATYSDYSEGREESGTWTKPLL